MPSSHATLGMLSATCKAFSGSARVSSPGGGGGGCGMAAAGRAVRVLLQRSLPFMTSFRSADPDGPDSVRSAETIGTRRGREQERRCGTAQRRPA